MSWASLGANTFCSRCERAGKDAPIEQTLREAFRTLIPLDSQSATLNVVAMICLFEDGCEEDVARIAKAIAQSNDRFALHVLCLQGGTAQALGVSEPERKLEHARLQAIADTLARQSYRAHAIVLDDYLASGAPINFTRSLLARFIATFLRGMIESYDALFPPNITPEENAIMAVGLAEVRFDCKTAADYLLRTAFVTTLERAGITQEHVDIPAAALRADQALDGIEAFYEEEYGKHIVPLLDQKRQEDEIAAIIPQRIANDTEHLGRQLTDFLSDDTLSLPEKEATFSLLMGSDNKRLTGSLYNGRVKDIDDALSVPLGIFIESYNELTVTSGKLPARDTCKHLRLPDITEEEDPEPKPNPRNQEAYNPLPELKQLKGQMLDQTAFLRSKTEEVEKLRQLVEGERRTDDVLIGGSVHRKMLHDVVEQPLDDVYTPKEGLKILDAVDLRPLCSPIRDQGNIGACTAFAVTAMYEMIVNASGGEKMDLSERFLFYHSNMVKGSSKGGSNFSEQLAVMGEHGICEEAIYPYTTTELSYPPSDIASENAQLHRVLRAQQIPLKSDGSQYDNILANHRLLTSALSEGHAIGFSLKVYDDFGKAPGGFIHLPTPSDDDEPGYHAMVIVGYSEAQKCYIVRNSWGEEFGDGGYCYIAAVYVDDPDYNNFACIITETTDDSSAIITTPKAVTVQFAATANMCQLAAAENTIDEAKIALAHLKEQYDSLYTYYTQLLQEVGVPSTRQGIRTARERKLDEAIAANKQRIDELRDSLPERLRECKELWVTLCLIPTIGALIAAAFGVWLNITFPWVLAVSLAIVAVYLWMQLRIKIRQCRKDLQAEIDDIVLSTERQKQEFLRTQIRFYTAGIVIDELSKMKLSLYERCQSLESYVKNLVYWHKEDKEQQERVVPSNQQMFLTLIDKQVLNHFFNENREAICSGIDIMGRFSTYQVATTSLSELREQLQKHTAETLKDFMQDFTMCDYILGKKCYPFLPSPDSNTLFNRLNGLCQVATRHNHTRGINGSLNISIHHSPSFNNTLHQAYDRSFPTPPQLLHTIDKEAITAFVTMRLPIGSLGR